MIIDNLKKIKSIEALDEFVKGIFNEQSNEQYIPAIINQGEFTVHEGEDFYLKLVLVHNKTKINRTWLKNNLTHGLIDPDFDEYKSIFDLLAFNVITLRNVKGSSLYQLNPNITNESIVEYEYDNNTFVNMFFNGEYSSIKGKPVLIQRNSKDLYVFRSVFNDYLNDPSGNVYPKYKLVAEIEYRTHNNIFESIQNQKYRIGNSLFDVNVYNGSMQILGSVEIGLLPEDTSRNKRNIKVLSLDTGLLRDHNPRNFNDDTEAGFVVFDRKILDFISEKYYLYDLTMYDKENTENSYLIDILSDKVVFWEGEYNKLPNSLKDIIDDYNISVGGLNGIISPGMMAWQLESDWNFHKKMYPEQQLAAIIKSKHFNSAIDLGVTFKIPENLIAFQKFITNIEKLTNSKLEQFNTRNEDVSNLIKIRDAQNLSVNIDIELLFRKYCYQMSKVIDNELFK